MNRNRSDAFSVVFYRRKSAAIVTHCSNRNQKRCRIPATPFLSLSYFIIIVASPHSPSAYRIKPTRSRRSLPPRSLPSKGRASGSSRIPLFWAAGAVLPRDSFRVFFPVHPFPVLSYRGHPFRDRPFRGREALPFPVRRVLVHVHAYASSPLLKTLLLFLFT